MNNHYSPGYSQLHFLVKKPSHTNRKSFSTFLALLSHAHSIPTYELILVYSSPNSTATVSGVLYTSPQSMIHNWFCHLILFSPQLRGFSKTIIQETNVLEPLFCARKTSAANSGNRIPIFANLARLLPPPQKHICQRMQSITCYPARWFCRSSSKQSKVHSSHFG